MQPDLHFRKITPCCCLVHNELEGQEWKLGQSGGCWHQLRQEMLVAWIGGGVQSARQMDFRDRQLQVRQSGFARGFMQLVRD